MVEDGGIVADWKEYAPSRGAATALHRTVIMQSKTTGRVLPELLTLVKINKRLCLFLKYLVCKCWPTRWYGQPSMPSKACGQLSVVSLFRVLPAQKGTP